MWLPTTDFLPQPSLRHVLCGLDRLGLFVVKEGALVTYIRLGMMQAEWAAKWYPVKRRTTVASAS